MKFIYKKIESPRTFKIGEVQGFAVTDETISASGSVAILFVDGPHGGVKDLKSDRFYVVSEGTGTFIIEDQSYIVSVDDVVIIPPNTRYDFSGKMKLIMFCSPPFNPVNDVKL